MSRTSSLRSTSATPIVLGAVALVAFVSVVALTIAGQSAGAVPDGSAGPVLDVEFDFTGAARTWTEAGSREDPFAGVGDDELLGAGRTVCRHATDEEISFGVMLRLLELDAHQTYVVLAEASDKLCPSQGERLARIMDG